MKTQGSILLATTVSLATLSGCTQRDPPAGRGDARTKTELRPDLGVLTSTRTRSATTAQVTRNLVEPFPNLATTAGVKVSSVLAGDGSNANLAAASHLTDGDLSTYWASEYADPQQVELDLGSVQEVGQIVIHWERAAAKVYELAASSDGKKWKPVRTVKKGLLGPRTETIDLPPGTKARLLRLDLTARATEWGYVIFEIVALPPRHPTKAGDGR